MAYYVSIFGILYMHGGTAATSGTSNKIYVYDIDNDNFYLSSVTMPRGNRMFACAYDQQLATWCFCGFSNQWWQEVEQSNPVYPAPTKNPTTPTVNPTKYPTVPKVESCRISIG